MEAIARSNDECKVMETPKTINLRRKSTHSDFAELPKHAQELSGGCQRA